MRKQKELKYLEPTSLETRPIGSEPTNPMRASWAGACLVLFAQMTALNGTDHELHTDPHSVVQDLLCDLMHWCRYNRIDFALALHSAFNTHYTPEATDKASSELALGLERLFTPKSTIRNLVEAAKMVEANWESGDLADAVNNLMGAAEEAGRLLIDYVDSGK